MKIEDLYKVTEYTRALNKLKDMQKALAEHENAVLEIKFMGHSVSTSGGIKRDIICTAVETFLEANIVQGEAALRELGVEP